MNWLWRKLLSPLPATGPELECPECGWADFVPGEPVVRLTLTGGAMGSRQVGRVVRCARCVRQFCAGPSGVYAPRPGPRERETEPKPTDFPRERSLRDKDQPWESHRS